METKSKVLVVGATGMLGYQITEALLQQGRAEVAAMVRPGGYQGVKQQKIATLTANGARIVEGDLFKPETLPAACKDIDIIVSAVQGNDKIILEGQGNLLKAAESAGVARMIPSDFSVDIPKLDYGDNINLDYRKKFAESLAKSPVQPTSILNGAFYEVMVAPHFGIVDWERGIFRYWGDGDTPCDLTAVSDAAAFTAAAATDPEASGRTLRIAGNVLTMKEYHQALEEGSGQKLKVQALGSVTELRVAIETKKKTATNAWEWISLQYLWCMVSGKGKLESLDNSRYSLPQRTSVVDFVKRMQS